MLLPPQRFDYQLMMAMHLVVSLGGMIRSL
jgi:hypothetical protein